MVVGRNPRSTASSWRPPDAIAYDKVPVTAPIDLRRVAEWTGTSVDEIQALNPELRRWHHAHPLPRLRDRSCRPAPATSSAHALPHASTEDLNSLKWHGVRTRRDAGHDRAQAARQHVPNSRRRTTSRRSPRSAPGRTLIIPRLPTTLLATGSERAAPAVAASRPVSGAA